MEVRVSAIELVPDGPGRVAACRDARRACARRGSCLAVPGMAWEPFRGETVVGDVRVLRGAAERDLFAYLPPSHGARRALPGRLHARRPEPLRRRDRAQRRRVAGRRDDGGARARRDRGDRRRHPGRARRRARRASTPARRPSSTSRSSSTPCGRSSRRRSTSTRGASDGASPAPRSAASRACTPSTRGPRRSASRACSARRSGGRATTAGSSSSSARPSPTRAIYIDVGDREMPEDETTRRRYVDGFERMTALLRSRGFDDGSLRAVLEPGGAHFETDWARRLPDAFRFLLGG